MRTPFSDDFDKQRAAQVERLRNPRSNDVSRLRQILSLTTHGQYGDISKMSDAQVHRVIQHSRAERERAYERASPNAQPTAAPPQPVVPPEIIVPATTSHVATECEIKSLTVACSHGGREMSLDVVGGKPNLYGTDYVLQVISKPSEPDEVTVKFTGECGRGKPTAKCPTVSIRGGKVNVNQPGELIKFRADPPSSQREDVGFLAFLKNYLIPKDLVPQRYAIQTMNCTGTGAHKATVEAFPSCSWKGEVAFGYEQPESFDKKINSGKGFTKLTDQGKWVLKGECKLKVGGSTWNFGASAKEREDHYFPGLKNAVGKIVPFLSDLAGDISKGSGKSSSLKIDWPNIALGGGVSLVEVKGKYNVDLEGEVALKMSPLIGATLSTDILDWIIRVAAPGYSEFLLRIKHAAAEGGKSKYAEGKFVIGLLLDISGKVEGELKWTKQPGDAWLSGSGPKGGEISASLGFKLTAKVAAEGRVFFVEVKMGAELALQAAKMEYDSIGIVGKLTGTTEAGEPGFAGQLIFTGAAIYFTYYLEVGIKATESDDAKKMGKTSRKGSDDDDLEEGTSVSKETEKMKKLVTLFEPHTWPEKAAAKANEVPKPSALNTVPL